MARAQDPRLALPDELRYAGRRRLPTLFRDVGADRAKYPVLADVVKTVEPALWAEDPTRALRKVMLRAVTALPDGESVEGCAESCTWQHFGRLLYFGSEVNDSLRTYEDYIAAAKEYSGKPWSGDNFNRPTGRLRAKLADILLKMKKDTIATQEKVRVTAEASSGEAISSEFKTPFIPRPERSKRLEEIWRIPPSEWEWKRMQRVCVIGDAGTGKSRLVREYTAADHPAWIDARDDSEIIPAIRSLMAARGQDTVGLEPTDIKKCFGQLLALPDGPPLVVMDGMKDPEDLDGFVPKRTRSRIIITSRRSPRKDDWAPIIRVGDMTGDEAERMVVSLLPDLTELECRSLAVTFGCRPLIIEHGCAAFVRDGTDDVEGFCRAISEDAASAITAIADKTDRELTRIYRHYIKLLDSDDPEALRLLELLAFVIPQWIPAEFCMAYLLGFPYVKQRQVEFAQHRYKAAVKPLVNYSLITTDEVLGISIPLLTQRILRGIFSSRFTEIFRRVQKLVDFKPGDLYDEGWLPYTVGGRMACLTAFTLYTHKMADGGRPELADEIGDAHWHYTAKALWDRNVGLQRISHHAQLMVRRLQLEEADGKSHDVDWDAFVASRAKYPLIQRKEAATLAASEKRLRERHRAEQTSERPSTSAREIAGELLTVMYEAFGRYEESPLGMLDFANLPHLGDHTDDLREEFLRSIKELDQDGQ